MPEADENMEGEEQLYEQVTDAAEQVAPMEGAQMGARWGCRVVGARARAVCCVSQRSARAHLHNTNSGVVEIQDLSTSANPEEEKLTGSYTVRCGAECVFECKQRWGARATEQRAAPPPRLTPHTAPNQRSS